MLDSFIVLADNACWMVDVIIIRLLVWRCIMESLIPAAGFEVAKTTNALFGFKDLIRRYGAVNMSIGPDYGMLWAFNPTTNNLDLWEMKEVSHIGDGDLYLWQKTIQNAGREWIRIQIASLDRRMQMLGDEKHALIQKLIEM